MSDFTGACTAHFIGRDVDVLPSLFTEWVKNISDKYDVEATSMNSNFFFSHKTEPNEFKKAEKTDTETKE